MEPKTKKHEDALLLVDSMRGRFIISQALVLAIASIESRPETQQEPSNVEDMRLLLEELFPLYQAIYESASLQDFLEMPIEKIRPVEVKASVNYDKPGK
tara:strand:- start:224 stop:520 length:297 start_codon:yes stop_codon:yes gene_type:complete